MIKSASSNLGSSFFSIIFCNYCHISIRDLCHLKCKLVYYESVTVLLGLVDEELASKSIQQVLSSQFEGTKIIFLSLVNKKVIREDCYSQLKSFYFGGMSSAGADVIK